MAPTILTDGKFFLLFFDRFEKLGDKTRSYYHINYQVLWGAGKEATHVLYGMVDFEGF